LTEKQKPDWPLEEWIAGLDEGRTEEARRRRAKEDLIAAAVRRGIIDARPDDDVLDDIRTHLWRLRQEQEWHNARIMLLPGLLCVLVLGLKSACSGGNLRAASAALFHSCQQRAISGPSRLARLMRRLSAFWLTFAPPERILPRHASRRNVTTVAATPRH
jgi:hypothetical protein